MECLGVCLSLYKVLQEDLKQLLVQVVVISAVGITNLD